MSTQPIRFSGVYQLKNVPESSATVSSPDFFSQIKAHHASVKSAAQQAIADGGIHILDNNAALYGHDYLITNDRFGSDLDAYNRITGRYDERRHQIEQRHAAHLESPGYLKTLDEAREHGTSFPYAMSTYMDLREDLHQEDVDCARDVKDQVLSHLDGTPKVNGTIVFEGTTTGEPLKATLNFQA